MNHIYKITIALLTHNRCMSGYLEEALDAILGQTYKDFELLVLDNYSADNTASFVLGYDDPRLTYIRQPPGSNPTTSYIRAAIMSRGEYIIMAHDDDIMESTMIERQVEFLEEHPGLMAVANNVSLMDESSVSIQARLYSLEKDEVFHTTEYIQRYFEEKLWLPAPTLLFKRDVYVAMILKWLGSKDQAYLASGDLWTLFTLNLKGPIGFIADPLLRYRQHPGQESRNVDQGFPMIEAISLFVENNRDNKLLQPHLPLIHAFLARFGFQDCCFKCTTTEQLRYGLLKIRKEWETRVEPENRGIDAILPFEIALYLFGLCPTISQDAFVRLKADVAQGGGRRGFRNFLTGLHDGRNLFDSRPDLKKIAIFGSMLNAYLIAECARQSGIEVIGCFDSSPARIGKTVLDIPVHPLTDLERLSAYSDAVIISSEHDQERALTQILLRHLPSNPSLALISWKELAATMCTHEP